MDALELCDITEISRYFEHLSSMKDDVLIAIAVKDTPGINFKGDTALLVRKLGLSSDLSGKSRCGYIGVVNRGTVLFDEVSERAGTVEFSKRIDGASVKVKSSGYGAENLARIVIDGLNYAIGMRGLNIVVYDVAARCLIDTVAFDTHRRTHPARRRDISDKVQLNRLEDRLAQLEKAEAKTQKMLEQAELRRQQDAKVRHLNFSRLQMMMWHALPEQETDATAAKRAFFQSLPKASGVLRKIQAANFLLLHEFDRVMKENDIPYWVCFGTLLGAARAGEFVPWDDDVDVCVMRSELPRIREAFKGHPFLEYDQFFWLHKAGRANMDVRYKIRFQANLPLFIDVFAMDWSENLNKGIVEEVRAIKLDMSRKARRFYRAKYPDTYADTRKYYDEEFGPMFDEALAKVYEMYGDRESENFIMWGPDNLPVAVGYRACFPRNWVYPMGEVEFCGQKFPAPREMMRCLEKIYGDPWSLPSDMFSHQHFRIGHGRERILDRLIEEHKDVLGWFDISDEDIDESADFMQDEDGMRDDLDEREDSE